MEIFYTLIGVLLTLIITTEYEISKNFCSLYYSGLMLLKDNLIMEQDINKTSKTIHEAQKIVYEMNKINFPLHITYALYKRIIENFRDMIYEYGDLYQCDAISGKAFLNGEKKCEALKKLMGKINKKLRLKE